MTDYPMFAPGREDLAAMTNDEWAADWEDGLIPYPPSLWHEHAVVKLQTEIEAEDFDAAQITKGALAAGFLPEKEIWMDKESLAAWNDCGHDWRKMRDWIRAHGKEHWKGAAKS